VHQYQHGSALADNVVTFQLVAGMRQISAFKHLEEERGKFSVAQKKYGLTLQLLFARTKASVAGGGSTDWTSKECVIMSARKIDRLWRFAANWE